MAKSPCRRANSRNAKPSPERRQGNEHGLDQLVVGAIGRHQAGEEVFRRNARRRRATTERSRRRARGASGSSALGSASATEPHTVPRARVCAWPTQGSASRQQRLARGELRPRQQFGLAHRRADADRIVLDRDAGKLADPHDVDQHLRPRHPHREQRHQRLPARDHARVAALGGEHVVRLGERLGAHVVERRRASCRLARQQRRELRRRQRQVDLRRRARPRPRSRCTPACSCSCLRRRPWRRAA